MQLTIEQKEALLNEVTFSASRSGGPGGQHVNKVSTRIELRFRINNSLVLTNDQKTVLLKKLARRINFAGELLVFSSESRSQSSNKEDAFQKFLKMIEKTLTPPKPRVKTNPPAASKEKRIQIKKKQAEKKENRKDPEL